LLLSANSRLLTTNTQLEAVQDHTQTAAADNAVDFYLLHIDPSNIQCIAVTDD